MGMVNVNDLGGLKLSSASCIYPTASQAHRSPKAPERSDYSAQYALCDYKLNHAAANVSHPRHTNRSDRPGQ